jgi:D-glycero-beta-D-manno-heptose 1-phosphate adenylyltransferase
LITPVNRAVKFMEKIVDSDSLKDRLNDLRRSGSRIVFTNGCFDILHAGHVRYLSEARSYGDILVVGLNSDKSVKLIKGEKRPIIPELQRAEVLAGLGCVDYVTLFHEPDPLKLIEKLKPDILVKGADWAEDQIVGADIVNANGGKVIRIRMVSGVSTSEIIQKILKTYGNQEKQGC